MSLRPLHDVTLNPSVVQNRDQHSGVGPQGNHAHQADALASYSWFGLSEKTAAQVIAQARAKVRARKVSFEAGGVPGDQIDKTLSAFQHLDELTSAEVRKKIV